MILKGLLTLLTQRPEFRRLVQQLQKAEGLPALTGITETARPFVIAALSAALKEPLLLVVGDETQAMQVTDTLKVMVQEPGAVFCLPDRDALPYERLMSDAETTQQRMDALLHLAEPHRRVRQLILPGGSRKTPSASAAATRLGRPAIRRA